MSMFRHSTVFTRIARQTRTPASACLARPFSSSRCTLAQGYGDGKGDPKAENAQEQGGSNPTKEAAEHPGPAAPAEGQGTGGATKAGSSSSSPSGTPGRPNTSGPNSPEDASAQSGGSRSKEAKETGSSPTGGAVGQGRSYHTSARRLNASQKTPEKEAMKAKGPDGAQPKILDSKKPGGGIDTIGEEKKAEVEKHNRDYEQGHDRAQGDDTEKVDKKFWEGQGGSDRQP
ncbi:MAG: hypothetical protein M1818_005212 [Claussenomyces sp. TS43310]|nr:MAG: hypothetical protein M1818_005212 [Claussenomyces sp. TS43310]